MVLKDMLKKTEAWCITAQYDDGEFMSYAGVEVKAPGSDIAFQTGRTDRNGCFVFLPDAQGHLGGCGGRRHAFGTPAWPWI